MTQWGLFQECNHGLILQTELTQFITLAGKNEKQITRLSYHMHSQ